MSVVEVLPWESPIRGVIQVPGDKSISHRAAILSAIADGTTDIDGFAPGQDCRSTLRCLESLGVSVEQHDDRIRIHGRGKRGLAEPQDVLNAGNSGTTMRLLTGLLCAQPFFSVLTGDESLRRRPMKRLLVPLVQMGAILTGRCGGELAPLALMPSAELRGICHVLPVASAQLKSALLLAGLYAKGTTEVIEPSWSRDHTERMLPSFGASVRCQGLRTAVDGGCLLVSPGRITVPGDFSSAAFWLAAALVIPGSQLAIDNVGINTSRTGLLEVLQTMGGRITVKNSGETAGEPRGNLNVSFGRLRGTEVRGQLIPRLIDEIPILAAVAMFAEGDTIIQDAAELRLKETDRIQALCEELRRLGGEVEELPDGMIIHGGRPLHFAACHSHGDHRIAMALAVAGLAAGGAKIAEAQSVDISYPGFLEELMRSGGCLIGA